MQLILKSCTIRPWQLDDAESLVEHANNRKVWLGLRDLFPHPYTIRDAHEFLRGALGDEMATKFCIEINNRAVGGMGIHPGTDVHSHTATLGYWLGEKFWGQGIMTDAVRALTDFWFENVPIHRISADVFANNPGSVRVLEKAGFVFEGRLKKCAIKNGELLDSLLYARTR